ncbi:MAG: hypothetical protein ACKVOE_04335 [Rickettsiales bacterium]
MKLVGTVAKLVLEQMGAIAASEDRALDESSRSVVLPKASCVHAFPDEQSQNEAFDRGVLEAHGPQDYTVDLMKLKALAKYNGIGPIPGTSEIKI